MDESNRMDENNRTDWRNGTDRSNRKISNQKKSNQKKSGGRWLLWGGAVVILVAAIIAAVFLLPKRVTFDIGYEAAEGSPERQLVRRGRTATEPGIADREGYSFIGWYEKNAKRPYDFTEPVTKNIKLSAKWYDLSDVRDSDGDDLPDSVELQLGTDINNYDSDGDGLSDGLEVRMLNTDPLNSHTGDGYAENTTDADNDPDGDGLTNLEEVQAGTNPAFYDTDWDGLDDRTELRIYHTDPLLEDTDGDGVGDGDEILLGSDPLIPEETFLTQAAFGELSEDEPVTLEVEAITDAEGAGTLTARQLSVSDGMAFSNCAIGLLGSAYDISADGSLESAEITFRLDPSLGTPGEDYEPRIYWYDEENKEYVELEDQVVTDHEISASLTHFSIYAVLDKNIVDFFIGLFLPMPEATPPDENNDLLPDEYAERINDGRILYDESGWLVGVLDLYGTEDDDWDDDGLKNGEEIEVIALRGWKPMIQIHSNPLVLDSDGDGIGDYAEVKQLYTDPLQYDRPSVGAVDQLKNDSKYDYSGRKRDGYDSVALFLYFRKYDKAKEAMIDYFYNYASEDSIRKNADKIIALTAYDDVINIVGGIGDLITTAKSIYSVVDTGTELADMDDMYYETLKEKEYLLSALNKEAIGEMRMEEVLAIANTFVMPDKLMNAEQNIMSGNSFKQFSGAAAVISLGDKALKSYKKIRDKEIFDLTKSFEDCQKGTQALSKSGKMSFNTKMTIAKDVVDGVENLLSTYETYSKIRANMDAFNMYTELLIDVRDHAEDNFVKDAAADVAKDILSKCGLDYFLDVSAALAREMTFAAFNVALDVLADVHPVFKIVDAFFDLYQYTGMIDLSESNVYFAVMSDISSSCERLLDRMITQKSQTFSYNILLYGNDVEKYLVQLAQSRIIGEYRFGEYVANNSMTGIIAAFLNGTKPDEYRQMQKRDILEVYSNANRLGLTLSSALPYYGETTHVPNPDEITGIADMVTLPNSLNDFLSYFHIYSDRDGGKEFSRDEIDELCSTLLDDMLFNAACVDYRIYPGEGRSYDVNKTDDPRGWSKNKQGVMVYVYDESQVKWILKNIFGASTAQYTAMLAAGEEEEHYYAEGGKIYYFTYGIGYDGTATTVLKAWLVDDEYHILYSEVHPGGIYGWADTPHIYYDGIYYAVLRYEKIDNENYWTLISNTEYIPEDIWGGNWQDDYYAYIMRGDYWEDGYYMIDSSDDYSPIAFGLHDMDADGIPELIGFSGGDSYAAEVNFVYTWQDGDIIPLGNLTGHSLFRFRDLEYPGIVEINAHSGYYSSDYMRLIDGELQEERIWFAQDENGQSKVEKERTENQELYDLYINKKYTEIPMIGAQDMMLDISLWNSAVIQELDRIAK